MLRLALIFSLVVGALAPRAGADEAAAVAKRHFEAAREAYRRADYQTAITEFEAAYAAKPSGVIRYNIAQADEKLGDIPGALLNYRRYLRETPNADDRPVVEAAMANLEKRLQERGVQELAVFSRPGGARVSIDGVARGTAPVSVELPPGSHLVAVEADGYQPEHRTITLAADKSLALDVALSPASAPAVAQAPQTSPQQVSLKPSSTSGLRIASYATAGIGVALAGLGLLENAQVGSDNARIRRGEGSIQGNYDDAKNAASIRNVAYIAGGAAVVAGAVMFVLSPSQPPTTTAGLSPTRGGFAAVVSTRF